MDTSTVVSRRSRPPLSGMTTIALVAKAPTGWPPSVRATDPFVKVASPAVLAAVSLPAASMLTTRRPSIVRYVVISRPERSAAWAGSATRTGATSAEARRAEPSSDEMGLDGERTATSGQSRVAITMTVL